LAFLLKLLYSELELKSRDTTMRIILLSSTLLQLIFFVVFFSCCEGFSLALPIDNDNSIATTYSSSGKNEAGTLIPKITYRSANAADIPDIVGLLMSSFDDENEEGGCSKSSNSESESNNGSDDNNNKTFMWDSIGEDNKQESLSPEQQRQFIETQLGQRMIDVKKEGSLPHSFLVATIPSSSISIVDDDTTDTDVVGFLEMGCLPSPIPISIGGNKNARPELPYIANVAVNPTIRRRKIGSTLVRLATKIAAKWIVSGSKTSFPPFLFLSVERDNHDALMFYERLKFEELNVKKSIQKIYLARVLD
jgi:ribosomal protein S18 acetylase RimI-like enzyme